MCALSECGHGQVIVGREAETGGRVSALIGASPFSDGLGREAEAGGLPSSLSEAGRFSSPGFRDDTTGFCVAGAA